jgi:hypothetical protein
MLVVRFPEYEAYRRRVRWRFVQAGGLTRRGRVPLVLTWALAMVTRTGSMRCCVRPTRLLIRG